jgi:hypothetical protein
MHFPKVWEHPWVPLPQENAIVLEPPLRRNESSFVGPG